MDPAREAKNVLDEFCPQMDRLVAEAIERDKIKAIEDAKKEKDIKDKKKTSSGPVKVNCNSAVWKNKPRCNQIKTLKKF